MRRGQNANHFAERTVVSDEEALDLGLVIVPVAARHSSPEVQREQTSKIT